MASSTHAMGDSVSGLINIRKFKEQGNPNSVKEPELSKITERAVIENIQSINPMIELSFVLGKMNVTRQHIDRNFRFTSMDMLDSPCVVPDNNSDGTKLDTPDEKMKKDLSQVKPSGNIVPSRALLITVIFDRPDDGLYTQGTKIGDRPHLKDSIQFHDGQTLADVRRALVCQNMNRQIGGDVGQNPHKSLGKC